METINKIEVPSPADSVAEAAKRVASGRKRSSMAIPRRKLEVPDIPGWRMYWFKTSNVLTALQGGYEFVNMDEVPNFAYSPANDSAIPSTNDLGSRIAINSGTDKDGKPEQLILMKIPFEWYSEDQRVIADRNAEVLGAIFKHEKVLGQEAVSAEDRGQSYVKTATLGGPSGPRILNRAPPKSKT